MSVPLTIATSDYDHVRDFRDGAGQAEGIDVDLARPQPARDVRALPRQPRMGRVGAVVRQVHRRGDAAGRRHHRAAGVPAARIPLRHHLRQPHQGHPARRRTCAASASACRNGRRPPTVYARGLLAHDFGVPLTEVDWVQAGINEKGRVEKVEIDAAHRHPPHPRRRQEPERACSTRARSTRLIGATVPACFGEKHPDVVRLFPDSAPWRSVLRPNPRLSDHARRRLRKAILRDNPWIARNLLNAFEEAKRRSLERSLDPSGHVRPVPWHAEHAAACGTCSAATFSLRHRRQPPTLELFLRYTHEQGIAHKLVKPEDIFPAGIMASVKV